MTGKLSPSMMCADFAQLPQTICEFEKGGVEYLHIDIMDGEFVSNFTLGTDFCTGLRQMTRIPLDIHLMINRPDLKISWFKVQPGEFVSVHWESTPHIQRTLAMIREAGGKPMLALNPATPIEVLDYVVGDIDGVLLMTVNPGFAGQKLIPAMLEKIQRTRAYLDAHGRKDASKCGRPGQIFSWAVPPAYLARMTPSPGTSRDSASRSSKLEQAEQILG